MKTKSRSSKFVAGVLGCLFTATASASLVYDSSILLSAQGFGNAPRDLTIQRLGNSTSPAGTESGCVGVSSTGTIVVGPAGCTQDAKFMGNGVFAAGGDEASPLDDNQKFGIPTLASRGITDASQIGILFNATEPGGDSIDVTDLTLNFFTSTGVLITSIDGQQRFESSFAGNGLAGFVFVVDAAQQVFLNNTVFNQPGFANFFLSLNSSLGEVGAGNPESFRIVNLGGGSVPPQAIAEPGSLALIGLALAGLAAARRRQASITA